MYTNTPAHSSIYYGVLRFSPKGWFLIRLHGRIWGSNVHQAQGLNLLEKFLCGNIYGTG